MKALLTSNKISTSLYTKFDQINTSRVKIETKWSLELNLECTTAMWKLIYKSCFQSVNDNTYKWFQHVLIIYCKELSIGSCYLVGMLVEGYRCMS